MSELWAFILSLSGLNWERLKRVSDLLNNWSCLCGMKTYSIIWGLFLCVYYGLFGGKRIFELLKGQNANLFNLNLRFWVSVWVAAGVLLCCHFRFRLSGLFGQFVFCLTHCADWFWFFFFLILSALAYLFLLYFNNVLFLLIKKKKKKPSDKIPYTNPIRTSNHSFKNWNRPTGLIGSIVTNNTYTKVMTKPYGSLLRNVCLRCLHTIMPLEVLHVGLFLGRASGLPRSHKSGILCVDCCSWENPDTTFSGRAHFDGWLMFHAQK